MYKPWDLEVWDVIYAELRDDYNHVYRKWKWVIISLLDNRSYQYPIYIEFVNKSGSINIKYEEVVEVLESKKKEEELSKKPFYFIRCV